MPSPPAPRTPPARFAVVGGGWRSEFFARVAQALPDRFELSAVVVRDDAKAHTFAERLAVRTVRTLEMALATDPLFVVLSVPWPVTPELILDLAARGVPVLAETPPAPDLAALVDLTDELAPLLAAGARVQVAEQYPYQPLHAARLALVASGLLGTITQAQVSVAHGYHGTRLLRRLLGVGYEPATVTARRFATPIVSSPDREGPPRRETIEPSLQTIAQLEFETASGPRYGVFDFTEDQYFSWIRAPRLLVRGERGELSGHELRYLIDAGTPMTLELTRHDAGREGNLEGLWHRGYTAGGRWLYRNPFAPARLDDDEIAVAECLARMVEHVRGGPSFSSVAEAAQDHYLAMAVEEAAAGGRTVRTTPKAWSLDERPR